MIVILQKEKVLESPWVSLYIDRKGKREISHSGNSVVVFEQKKQEISKHVAFSPALTLEAERALLFSRRLVRVVRRLHIILVVVIVKSTTIHVIALALVDF